MIFELNDEEFNHLLGSSIVCGACDELYYIYKEHNYFDTEKLTRQQLIHIETTCRKNGELVK